MGKRPGISKTSPFFTEDDEPPDTHACSFLHQWPIRTDVGVVAPIGGGLRHLARPLMANPGFAATSHWWMEPPGFNRPSSPLGASQRIDEPVYQISNSVPPRGRRDDDRLNESPGLSIRPSLAAPRAASRHWIDVEWNSDWISKFGDAESLLYLWGGAVVPPFQVASLWECWTMNGRNQSHLGRIKSVRRRRRTGKPSLGTSDWVMPNPFEFEVWSELAGVGPEGLADFQEDMLDQCFRMQEGD
jgi:hypothetical protein